MRSIQHLPLQQYAGPFSVQLPINAKVHNVICSNGVPRMVVSAEAGMPEIRQFVIVGEMNEVHDRALYAGSFAPFDGSFLHLFELPP